MAETIYSIPINEAFEQYDGCPLCRLRAKLEQDSLDYTLGAAMMEPDVRTEMNRLGFCRQHFARMSAMRSSLSLALILESHLDLVIGRLDVPAAGGKRLLKKAASSEDAGSAAKQLSESCYICSRVAGFEEKYIDNTLHLYRTDERFRKKLASQPLFCLEHAGQLLTRGAASLSPAVYESIYADITHILRTAAAKCRSDVTEFTRSFDHRNAGKPMSDDARSSTPRSISLLAGCEDFE